MISRSSWILGSLLASLSLGLSFTVAPAAWGQFLSSGRDSQVADSSGYSMLFVDPRAGSDGAGDGSQRRPYGTITHALSVAQPNSVVVLAPGEYSQASGESFPLRLKPGVTVQGSPARPGQIVIRGGNSYLSPTQGLQNVAVLAADAAGLGNVTVINPHSAGLGLWIETGSPVIREVIFAENGRFGMFIAGAGSPVIQGNRFMGNSGAGLAIAGPSTASILDNLFDRNGTGIQIGGGATPQIARNRILQNRDGLMVRSDARPSLQDNVIAQNRHNGIVEFQATAAEPIAHKTESQVVAFQSAQPESPAPEELLPAEVATPEIVVGEPPAAAAPAVAEVETPEPTPIAAAIAAVSTVEAAIATPPTREEVSAINSRPPLATATIDQTPAEPTATALPVRAESPLATTRINQTPEATAEVSREAIAALPAVTETAAIEIPTPAAPAIETSPPAMLTPALPQLEMRPTTPGPNAAQSQPETAPETAGAGTDRIVALRQWLAERAASSQPASAPLASEEGEAIELTVTPPPVENVARAQTPVATAPLQPTPEPAQTVPLASSADAPLRVPGTRIPVGSGGLQSVTVGDQPSGDGPPAPPSRAASLGLNYRVVVEATDESQQDALRAVVSDAFRVRLNGRTMMQAGAYPDRETADMLVESLRSQGFEARVMAVQ